MFGIAIAIAIAIGIGIGIGIGIATDSVVCRFSSSHEYRYWYCIVIHRSTRSNTIVLERPRGM